MGPSFVLLEIICAICVSAWHHYHAIAVHHFSISYLPQEDVVSMSKLARDAATLWARSGSGWDGPVEVRHLPGSAALPAVLEGGAQRGSPPCLGSEISRSTPYLSIPYLSIFHIYIHWRYGGIHIWIDIHSIILVFSPFLA